MRDRRFTFVCTGEERMMLEVLASKRHRTKSDAIRLLIRVAFQECNLGNKRLRVDGSSNEKENFNRS